MEDKLEETKRCVRCGISKGVSEFNVNRAKKDGLQTHCRVCKKSFQGAWYEANKARHIGKVRQLKDIRTTRNMRLLIEYLQNHPCVDCGEIDPLVLQFDHVRGTKRETVGVMVSMGLGWATIAAEIEKCELRCANCHLRCAARQFSHSRYALLTRLSLEK